DEVAGRKRKLVEQVEQAPHPDAVAVVAPGEGARVGCRAFHRDRMAEAGAEREVLDVDAEIDGEALAVRPVVVRALGDRRIVVALVMRKFHGPRPRLYSGRVSASAAPGAAASRTPSSSVVLPRMRRIC